MRGQWIGTYQGSVEGRIIINIDEVADHYEAVASVIPNDNKNIPSSVAFLVTDSKNLNQKLKANTYPIHPDTGVICKWEQIKNRYPADVSHSKTGLHRWDQCPLWVESSPIFCWLESLLFNNILYL